MQSVELQILLKTLNTQGVDDLTRKLGGLKDAAGQSSPAIDRLNQSMSALGLGTTSATSGLTQFLPTLSGVGVAALGVGVGLLAAGKATFDFVAAQAKLAKETTVLADRLGLTIGQTEKLKFMADRTGSSLEGFGIGSVKLAAALTDANGEGKKAAETLKLLGINTNELSGKQKEVGNLLLETTKRLSLVDSEAKRALLSTRLFGEDGAKSVKALLKSYEEAEAAANRVFGPDGTAKATKTLAETNKAIEELESSIAKLKRTAAAEFSPLVVPIVAAVTATISGNLAGKAQYVYPFSPYEPLSQAEDNFYRDSIRTDLRGAIDALPGRARINPVIPDEKAEKERERLARKAEEDRKRAAQKLEQKNTAFDQILDSLDQKGLDPLARLLFDTGDRLAELVKKYGALTGEQAGTVGAAFGGSLARLNRANPLEFDPAPNVPNIFGVYRSVAQTVEVDPGANKLAIDGFREKQKAQEQIIRLLAGPGGELEAERQIASIRIASAETALEKDLARLDFNVRLLDLAKRQKDEFRSGLGSTFDALLAGKSGIGGYLSGFGINTGRTIFQNVGSLGYDAVKDRFRLPGQTGSDGTLNLFGKALQGTPFGVSPIQFSTDKNTDATDRLTGEVRRLTKTISGGGTAIDLNSPLPGMLGGTYGDLISDGNGITGKGGILNKISPRAGSALSGFGAGAASVVSAGLFAGLRSDDYSVTLPDGSATTASALGLMGKSARLGNTVASAGALATAGFGIYSGVKQGGARGAVTAAGSGAGAIAALLPLIGVSGPAAPIFAAAALGLGLASTLFGDPKKQRDSAIGREVDSRRFSDFSGTSYNSDVFGRSFDYNSRGDLRPIVVNVSTMDLSGFVDRRDDIAEAVRMAMSEQHPINKEIQSSIIPAA